MGAVADPGLDRLPVEVPDSWTVAEARVEDEEWESIPRGPATDLFLRLVDVEPNRLLRSTTLNPNDIYVPRGMRLAFAEFLAGYQAQLKALNSVYHEIAFEESRELASSKAGLVQAPVLKRLPSRLELRKQAERASGEEKKQLLARAAAAAEEAQLVETDALVWTSPDRVGKFDQRGMHFRVDGDTFCLPKSLMPMSREADSVRRFYQSAAASRVVSWVMSNGVLPRDAGADILVYLGDRETFEGLRSSDRKAYARIKRALLGKRK